MNPSRYIEHLEIGCEADEVLGDHNDGFIEIDSKSDDDQETTDTDDDRYVDDVTLVRLILLVMTSYQISTDVDLRDRIQQALYWFTYFCHSFYDLHGLSN